MESGQVDLTGRLVSASSPRHKTSAIIWIQLSKPCREGHPRIADYFLRRLGRGTPDDGTESRLSDSSGHDSYACNGEAPVRIMLDLE